MINCGNIYTFLIETVKQTFSWRVVKVAVLHGKSDAWATNSVSHWDNFIISST